LMNRALFDEFRPCLIVEIELQAAGYTTSSTSLHPSS
jgi:hypothetical protein